MDLSDIQGRYTVQLQIRILLSVLGFFLPYLLLVWLSLSVLAPFAGIVGVVIWLVVTKNEKAESESSEIIKQIPVQQNVYQNIIQGDNITKTEVKDSVLNRSNIGSDGKTKAEHIQNVKELLDSGAIDDDEFKQMKKEILGK